jgi:hypothetical protein
VLRVGSNLSDSQLDSYAYRWKPETESCQPVECYRASGWLDSEHSQYHLQEEKKGENMTFSREKRKFASGELT